MRFALCAPQVRAGVSKEAGARCSRDEFGPVGKRTTSPRVDLSPGPHLSPIAAYGAETAYWSKLEVALWTLAGSEASSAGLRESG